MSELTHRKRTATIERTTGETDIRLAFDLDGTGVSRSNTGVLFLDHMLDALSRHGRFSIDLSCTGDTQMDPHHTVEDVGIAMGQAIRIAQGDRAGIARFACAYAPLDESLARVVVDCSGRPYFEYCATFPEEVIGKDFASSLVEEFWRSLAVNAMLTVHIDLLRSRNAHHAAEAIFKAGALALRDATRISGNPDFIPSTKGVLA